MASRELRPVVVGAPLHQTQRDLNHLVNRDNGDGAGRLWLVGDDDGTRKNPIGGATLASNTYRLQARSGGGNHGAFLLAATAAKATPTVSNSVLLIQDAAVTLGAGRVLRIYSSGGTNFAQITSDANGGAVVAGSGSSAGVLAATAIALGTNPATTGAVRVANNAGYVARNQANNADVQLLNFTTSDQFDVGVVGTQTNAQGTWVAPIFDPPTVTGQLTRGGLAGAWGHVVGGGGASLGDNYNTASVTRNGAGDFTVTIDRDFAGATYSTVVTVLDNAANLTWRVNGQASGSFDVHFRDAVTGVLTDPDAFGFVCFGA